MIMRTAELETYILLLLYLEVVEGVTRICSCFRDEGESCMHSFRVRLATSLAIAAAHTYNNSL